MAANRVGTILTADFGSVHTRAVLIDVVDGEYRVVARETGLTTLGFPVDELNQGLQRLLSQMSDVTGRNFYNQIGRIISPEDAERNGVDSFITTSSAGRPMKAVLVGLMPDISVNSALRALSGTYIEVLAQIHLRDGRRDEERLNAILLNRPDLLLIVGGTDKGAKTALLELLKIVHLALTISEKEQRPNIIFAGNKDVHAAITELFGDLAPLMLTENLRPSMENESFTAIGLELDKAYDKHRETQSEAFRLVSDMSSTGLLPSAQSYTLVADYFAKSRKGNVIALDIGSSSSVMVGVFNGQVSTRISTTTGLGHSAEVMRQDVGDKAIAAWLPYYPQAGEIRNYALNKLSRPYTIPLNSRDMFMEHGFLRAGLRKMASEARKLWHRVEPSGALPNVKMIIAGGSALTNTGNAAFNMMLIADVLQPTGITEVVGDPHGIIPAINAIAKVNPTAAVQLLENGSLDYYGTLLSLDGNVKVGRTIANLNLTTEDGEKIKRPIKAGEIIALPDDTTIKITLSCSRGFGVGGKGTIKLTLQAGTGCIVIDARGRNFNAPNSVEERAKLMPVWVQKASDSPEVIAIPEEWLQKPSTAAEKPVQMKVIAEREKLSSIEMLALDDSVFPALQKDEETAPEAPAKDKKAKGKKGKAATVEDDDDLRGLLG